MKFLKCRGGGGCPELPSPLKTRGRGGSPHPPPPMERRGGGGTHPPSSPSMSPEKSTFFDRKKNFRRFAPGGGWYYYVSKTRFYASLMHFRPFPKFFKSFGDMSRRFLYFSLEFSIFSFGASRQNFLHRPKNFPSGASRPKVEGGEGVPEGSPLLPFKLIPGG